MKLAEVEIQADGKKATFFYTADDRVDFRELIRLFAGEFKVKVEMRQIGARQEAGKVGGIGSCGRELCCSTWLTDFKSVNTTAARYQNLSINQTKLSGQCGRLKCCLNYELDTYLDALQHFPDNADVIQITRGPAYLVKKDIFKNLMWYTLPESNKYYPLTIVRVKEIQKMNAQGLKPDELEPVEIVSSKPKEVEPEFVDVVGQISLRSLERNSRRRKDREPVREAKQMDRKETQHQPYQQQSVDRTQQNQQKPDGQQKDNQRPQQQVPGNTVRPAQGVQQQRPANQGAGQQGRPPLQPSVKQKPTNQRPPNQGHPQQKPPLQKPPPENKKLPPEDKK
jgi:hypothetical protein